MNIPNYFENTTPIFCWTIRQLLEHRHNSTWRALSPEQAQQILSNCERHTLKADDVLSHLYANAFDAMLPIVAQAAKSSDDTAAALATARQQIDEDILHTTMMSPADNVHVFSLYWYEIFEHDDEYDHFELHDAIDRLDVPTRQDLNNLVALLTRLHGQSIEQAYRDWSDSLHEVSMETYPPPLEMSRQ